MKNVLFVLLFSISGLVTWAQNDQRLPAYGYEMDRVRALKALQIPYFSGPMNVQRKDSLLPQLAVNTASPGVLQLYNPFTGTWSNVGSGIGVPLNEITNATASSGLRDHGTNTIQWYWNNLGFSNSTGMQFASTSTNLSDGSAIFRSNLAGTSVASGRKTYAGVFSNISTGTNNTNFGLWLLASGGTQNIALATTAGQVAINTITPHASALLHLSSTTQGSLLTPMSGAQMNAISSPANGLMLYNTDSLAYCYFNGTAWIKIGTGGGGGGGSSWSLRDSTKWVNVLTFGVIANDGLQDTAGFRAALEYARPLKLTVVVPDGDYNIDTSIVLDKQAMIALGGNARFLTSNTNGVTSNANQVFSIVWLKDSCLLDGFKFKGSGRASVYNLGTGVFPTQNGIRISGNANRVLNSDFRDLYGFCIYQNDEAFTTFDGNVISGFKATKSTGLFMNYYASQYGLITSGFADSLRIGFVEYGNNNTHSSYTIERCDKAGVVNNGVGDDHDMFSAINMNHCNNLYLTSLQHGVNFDNCQFWYTNIVGSNADRAMFTGGAFGQMNVSHAGTSTVRTINISNVYDGGGVSYTATGTGVILKAGVQPAGKNEYVLEAINAAGVSSMSLTPDTTFFKPNRGLIGSDSLATASNLSNKVVMLRDTVTGLWQQIKIDSVAARNLQQVLAAGATVSTDHNIIFNGHVLQFSGTASGTFGIGTDILAIQANQMYINGLATTDTTSYLLAISGGGTPYVYKTNKSSVNQNIANTDLTATGDRTFDLDGNDFTAQSGTSVVWAGQDVQFSGTSTNYLTGGAAAIHLEDTVKIITDGGRINIDSLAKFSSVTDTAFKRMMTRDKRTGKIEYFDGYFPTAGAGGGASASGNFGNIQFNRFGLFVGNDSLDYESATGFAIKNDISILRGTGDARLNLKAGTSSASVIDFEFASFSHYYMRADASNSELSIRNGASVNFYRMNTSGMSSFGNTAVTPSAWVTTNAGTSTTPPIKTTVTSAALLATPQAGAWEVLVDTAYYTGNNGLRRHLTLSIYGSGTLDFGSTAASSSSDLTVTITGAADGDVVSLGVPNGSVDANSMFTAWVSAANTVTVRHNNYQTVEAIDPASGTFKIRVMK